MDTIIRVAACGCLCVVLGLGSSIGSAQESRLPVDEEGHVVDFERDIAPLFAAHCIECHSGDSAKADFRIAERENVLGYIEPEDAEGSMLYFDYMLSEDPDTMMPPASHGGPLTAAQLALVRLWIEEGAEWPESAVVAAPGGDEETEALAKPQPVADESLGRRIWAFQGYFHPATVHFPIALLTVGGLFVLLGVKWPKMGTQVPLACLILGSISAVVASAMGWSFAYEQGYGAYKVGWSKTIDAHRWSGTIVAVAAVILAVIAVIGVTRDNKALNRLWKLGLFALALTVGLVGHQGGELKYGDSFYTDAFKRLWGRVEEAEQSVEQAVERAVEEVVE